MGIWGVREKKKHPHFKIICNSVDYQEPSISLLCNWFVKLNLMVRYFKMAMKHSVWILPEFWPLKYNGFYTAKGFCRTHSITLRQKIIKTLLPVMLKPSSQCIVEQVQYDAITEAGSITVLGEKLFGRIRLTGDTMSMLWWLCISTPMASHFCMKLPRFYILIWRLRNQKTKQKSQNSKDTVRVNLSSFQIYSHFVRPHWEIKGEVFNFSLDQ